MVDDIWVPPHPSSTALRVSLIESVRAQQPVAGIMRATGRPASVALSSSLIFSSTDSESASELVPKSARPTSLVRSQRQWRISRSASGCGSGVKGVATGARTPLILRSLIHQVLSRVAPRPHAAGLLLRLSRPAALCRRPGAPSGPSRQHPECHHGDGEKQDR